MTSAIVPPGKTLRAIALGILLGVGLPLVGFFGLAAVLPKNEGTMGYILAGIALAVPSGVAGIIAGVWRGEGYIRRPPSA